MNHKVHVLSRLFLATVLSLVCSGLSFSQKGNSGGGQPPSPPYKPEIAYTDAVSNGTLFAMNADGSNRTALVTGAGTPIWRYSSDLLIFSYLGTGLQGPGLYQINTRLGLSGGFHKLLELSASCFGDVNSQQILVLKPEQDRTPTLYFLNLNCLDPTLPQCALVTVDTAPFALSGPRWSGDGTKIAARDYSGNSSDVWTFDVQFDQSLNQAALTNPRNVSEGLRSQGYVVSDVSDWSNRTNRWLLLSVVRLYAGGKTDQLIWLADLNPAVPVYYNLTGDASLSNYPRAKFSPCDNQIVVEDSRQKLLVFDLTFDPVTGDFLGVANRSVLPSGKREFFYRPDWKTTPCPAP